MNRLIILTTLLLAQVQGFAQGDKIDNPLQNYLNTWVEDAYLKTASISFLAFDLNKRTIIADHNSRQALVPASTMKLVTTASALEVLGSGYRFSTRIEYTGAIDSNGVLNGDLIIKGGGDPSLGSSYFPTFNNDFKDQWVKAVQENGIKSVNGQVIADASVFGINVMPANWSWGDMGNYYGAPANGLTIYDNKTDLIFRSGKNAGDSTWIDCTEPYVPGMLVHNSVKAANSSKDNAYIYGGMYDRIRLAEGSIPKNEEEFKVKASIYDPAYLASVEFEGALADAGINCAYRATTLRHKELFEGRSYEAERKEIHKLSGATVGTLTYWTNLVSVNLFAEHLLKGVGVKLTGNGSTYSSSEAIKSFWTRKGVNMIGFEMTDGSGLSRANAVSARHLVRILSHMSGSGNASTYKKSLSIAGHSGTLRSIGKGTKAANNLIGKSGSMTRVRSYAGYVKSASGRDLAFAIVVNNYTCTGYQMKQRLEKLMVEIANFNG